MAPDEDPPGVPRTVYMPPPESPAPPVGPERPAATPTPTPAASTPHAAAPIGRVEIGAVLNGIYEVKRLIGRGGMGEVFEGVNVNDDHDRVAIKVMLPSLAADPNVQAMFRKEARTLTRLSHPAVVQYRVLAQEPSLGVFYIVTEFLDGEALSDIIGRVRPGAGEIAAFLRRMAEGLKAAHDLGAVHRDMSPDNVLLPQSRLDRAKIIDFGIAKDLDPSKATIVGTGFAGKLGYVAPEQFGDFGRDIGPWTDVYSLGLVTLTLAAGHNIDMGATLVEAVDKRRAGPDLGPAPDELRPILARMLAADPAQRARSMDEVLAMLDGAPIEATAPSPTSKPPKPGPARAAGGIKPLPLILGAGAAVVVAVIAVFVLMPKKVPSTTPMSAAAGGASANTARRAIEAALGGVPCSWLNVSGASGAGGGVAVKLAGVAATPQAVEAAVDQAARRAGVSVSDVDSTEVQTVGAPACAPLDAFRAFRADTSVAGARLSTSQSKYTLEKQANGGLAQKAVITMAIGDPSLDFALYGLEPSGAVDNFKVDSRKDFQALEQDPKAKDNIADLGADSYRLSVITSHAGLSGLLLLTGKGPFDPALIAVPADQRGPDWAQRIQAAAAAGGWKAEMVWYRTVAADGSPP